MALSSVMRLGAAFLIAASAVDAACCPGAAVAVRL